MPVSSAAAVASPHELKIPKERKNKTRMKGNIRRETLNTAPLTRANPVRRLATERAFTKGSKVEIEWDGKTDSGAEALNGRYLVLLEAKDGTGIEKKLVTVVMVK